MRMKGGQRSDHFKNKGYEERSKKEKIRTKIIFKNKEDEEEKQKNQKRNRIEIIF